MPGGFVSRGSRLDLTRLLFTWALCQNIPNGINLAQATAAEPEVDIPSELLPLKEALDSAQLGVQKATTEREIFEEKVCGPTRVQGAQPGAGSFQAELVLTT